MHRGRASRACSACVLRGPNANLRSTTTLCSSLWLSRGSRSAFGVLGDRVGKWASACTGSGLTRAVPGLASHDSVGSSKHDSACLACRSFGSRVAQRGSSSFSFRSEPWSIHEACRLRREPRWCGSELKFQPSTGGQVNVAPHNRAFDRTVCSGAAQAGLFSFRPARPQCKPPLNYNVRPKCRRS